jgi:hypothetical protein
VECLGCTWRSASAGTRQGTGQSARARTDEVLGLVPDKVFTAELGEMLGTVLGEVLGLGLRQSAGQMLGLELARCLGWCWVDCLKQGSAVARQSEQNTGKVLRLELVWCLGRCWAKCLEQNWARCW